MRHEHFFEAIDTGTLMTDKFYYETPFGIFGRIFDKLILKRYMTKFLMQRNRFLKEIVENQAVDFF